MAMGYLDSKGDVTEMEGRQSSFDQVTQSPWIYNSTTGELVVYDDMRSLFVKSRYAKEQGLKGVKIFSVQHDTTDGALLRAVRGAWTSGKKSYEEWRKEVDGA